MNYGKNLAERERSPSGDRPCMIVRASFRNDWVTLAYVGGDDVVRKKYGVV